MCYIMTVGRALLLSVRLGIILSFRLAARDMKGNNKSLVGWHF